MRARTLGCPGAPPLQDLQEGHGVRGGIHEAAQARPGAELESLLDAINEDDMAAVTDLARRLRTFLGNLISRAR